MNKYFIITVDTEGDNLWAYKNGDTVTTENSLFVQRFQELCNKYAFKPVWLTNYEMACDKRFVDYIKPKMQAGLCEVGIHVHAWNNPPMFQLNELYDGNSYLVEYPGDIMRAKFKYTYDIIKEQFGEAPTSHRAGRWIMNEEYFKILEENNIAVDCSFTPLVDWSTTPGTSISGGCDYTKSKKETHRIGKVLEVPMTIDTIHKTKTGSLKHQLKTFLLGKTVWMRPALYKASDMIELVNVVHRSKRNYIEFMVHSSELMPGGSPYFKDKASIDALYETIEKLFVYIKNLGYEGASLKEYSKVAIID